MTVQLLEFQLHFVPCAFVGGVQPGSLRLPVFAARRGISGMHIEGLFEFTYERASVL